MVVWEGSCLELPLYNQVFDHIFFATIPEHRNLRVYCCVLLAKISSQLNSLSPLVFGTFGLPQISKYARTSSCKHYNNSLAIHCMAVRQGQYKTLQK